MECEEGLVRLRVPRGASLVRDPNSKRIEELMGSCSVVEVWRDSYLIAEQQAPATLLHAPKDVLPLRICAHYCAPCQPLVEVYTELYSGTVGTKNALGPREGTCVWGVAEHMDICI